MAIAIQTSCFAGLFQRGAGSGRHFFRKFQVPVTLLHLKRHALFYPLDIFLGLRQLSFPFADSREPLAPVEYFPTDPQTDRTVVVDQERHAVLILILRESTYIRHVLR